VIDFPPETVTITFPFSCGGVYLWMRDDEVLYIGQSFNIFQRIFSGHHALEAKEGDQLKIIPIATENERLQVEAALIEQFQPPMNGPMRAEKRRKRAHTTDDFRLRNARSVYLLTGEIMDTAMKQGAQQMADIRAQFPDIKEGVTVRIASGSPLMTVGSIQIEAKGATCTCVWLDESKNWELRTVKVPIAALRVAEVPVDVVAINRSKSA
jgi:hypothetical protein